MKFTPVVLLAASASAAHLKRQSTSLAIGTFDADCIPHSTLCSYNFTVVDDPSLPASHCGAFLASNSNLLPNVTDGSCPDNVAYTWTITSTSSGGLDFSIGYPFNSRSNITYCHSIAASELTVQNDGASVSQHYTGAANFTATVENCVVSAL
ncbi:hypothetical protein BX600DRAFT_510119 [Xylariales sp. PMI_506]|nr:hypothetical protein BX600DRAFT_510119 [Xylariales sp. PMI_506]